MLAICHCPPHLFAICKVLETVDHKMGSSKHSLVMPKGITLFSTITGLRIKEILGVGDRIANTIFITNDNETKKRIISDTFEIIIGAIDFDEVFKENTLLAYSPLKAIKVGEEQDTIRGFLQELCSFERMAWFSFDHAQY